MAGGSGTHPVSGSDMAPWGAQNRQPGQREEEFVSWGSWTHPLLFFLRSWGPKDDLFPCLV